MGKVVLGVLIGALCGAIFTWAVLLGPFSSVAGEQRHSGSGTYDSTLPKGHVDPEGQALKDNQEKSRRKLQHLLASSENARQVSAATQAQLQREFEVLALIDPIATAELIVTTTSLIKITVLRLFLDIWIETQGVNVVHAMPKSWREDYPELHRKVFQTLANSQPELTLPHIMALPPSELRASLMVNIAYALDVEKMPTIFLSLAKLTENEQFQFLDLNSIELANKVPLQLLDWSSTLSEPQRSMAARSALEGLARHDPKAALGLIDDQSLRNKPDIIRLALRKLTESDPQLAVAEAEARGRFFAEVATIWAYRDPANAARWFMEQTPEGRRSSHDPLLDIASSWGKRDFDAALEFSKTLPEELRGVWVTTAAARIQFDDPARFETLAQGLADTAYASDLYTRLAFQRYNTDPKAALSQVLSLTPPLRDKPLASLINREMEHTPESAASLVQEIADQEIRMRSLGKVLRRWQRAEDGTMERWLTNQASPSLRDEAYATLAVDQPELLKSIKNREMRVATYLDTQHRARSTAGMRRLLKQIDLSEAQWQALDNAATTTAEGSR